MNKKIAEFSSGMKVRLKILISITHNAELLILDEPTAGLDVQARNDVLDILREYMAEDENRSIIITSHISSDIENLCDTAVVRRVNKKEHKLYRQLLLRTVAMENQIPYVTASLNDSEMVFKDRILYMVNIRKLRKGILPGILVTLLLAGGNLVFNVSAGTDTVSVETEKSGIEKNADPEKNNVPDYAPFSEMVTMQKAAETQDEGGVTENTDTEDSVDEEEKADAETNDEPAADAETNDEPAL